MNIPRYHFIFVPFAAFLFLFYRTSPTPVSFHPFRRMNGVSLVEEKLYEAWQDADKSLFSIANEYEYDKIVDTFYG